MVQLTSIVLFSAKKPMRKYLRTGFMDSLRLYLRAGSGGNGLPKFGGIGGQGGNISFIAKENITLDRVISEHKSKRIIAKHGRNSTHNFILGTPGDNVTIEVPVGVTVLTDDGQKLGELNSDGEEILVAKGGIGGHSKNGFLGQIGDNFSVKLDLKLISDIGLVGFPNAGKSTLLKAVSQAKPKIASYPFTTIRPNVGVIVYKDLRQISMADLPGLIEGAHANRGMGHKFLKHIERTKIILMVVDINGFQLSPHHEKRSCLDNVVLLNKELEMYNPDLVHKPTMLVINKMDTEGSKGTYNMYIDRIKNLEDCLKDYPDELRPEIALKFQEILPVSAKNRGEDIEMLKQKLRIMLDLFASENNLDEMTEVRNMKRSQKERGPVLV